MALQHYRRDLEALKQRFLELFARVEESLQKSLQSFHDRDTAAAEQVASDDRRIDAAEVAVEEECLRMLALYQPIAQDLRYIISLLKINRDLERIGDQAAGIANLTLDLAGRAQPDLPALRPLMDQAVGMLQRAFRAVIQLDTDLAREVWNEDDRADALARESFARLEARLRAEPDRVGSLLPLYSLVFILERIGDHAANIAKDVLYTVLGEIVRHRGREFKTAAGAAPGA